MLSFRDARYHRLSILPSWASEEYKQILFSVSGGVCRPVHISMVEASGKASDGKIPSVYAAIAAYSCNYTGPEIFLLDAHEFPPWKSSISLLFTITRDRHSELLQRIPPNYRLIIHSTNLGQGSKLYLWTDFEQGQATNDWGGDKV
jgi:hypothetical protein